jgi:hypothetical protein
VALLFRGAWPSRSHAPVKDTLFQMSRRRQFSLLCKLLRKTYFVNFRRVVIAKQLRTARLASFARVQYYLSPYRGKVSFFLKINTPRQFVEPRD